MPTTADPYKGKRWNGRRRGTPMVATDREALQDRSNRWSQADVVAKEANPLELDF
ncbi:MAG: hypothetical protein ACKN81_13240 [Pirellulaceae bacterium]